ncbi:MAG TPA: ATP-binding protein [Thermoanaerobaculia bacterium]
MNRILRYAFALVCVAAALAATELLGPWAEPDFSTLYVLAILVVSSVCGLGPGLFATVLAATSIAYAQVGWRYAVDLGWDDVFRAGVFFAVAVIVSSLVARQRAAEEQLREAVMQLKKADSAKDDFLAMLSHELRTPLTSILGWATILGDRNVDAATVATAADSIRQSARSQQYLVDDLLDLSRIVFDKFRIDASPVDLVPLVKSTAELIKPVADAKKVELRTELPKRPCVIVGDDQRIKQVIWNFLTNAVKFTPSGGEVDLRIEVDDSQVQVVVSDNGEGIEPLSLPHVFDRFQQSDNGAKKGGLGLGLAIARYVVEAHHGSVSALSEGRGKGATFIARFPLTMPTH